jgi:outer membrane protein OmpA-like peptidoglycan-associated protein
MSYDLNLNRLYFTRSHKDKRTLKGVTTDTTYLRIMSADLNTARPEVKPININVERYSVCHPALSANGKSMIFASNKPGGFGGYDLYMAFNNETEWSGIINLGPQINSASHELFPFWLNDSILIFSSQRIDGVGKLDLYVSALQNGSWTVPEILPSPFNTQYDDLGMVVRENMKSGYLASNRPGGAGKDDIFRFESTKPIFGAEEKVSVLTSASILDKLSLEGIAGAKFTVTPLDIDINNYTLSTYNVDMMSGRDPGDLVLKLSPKNQKSVPILTASADGTVNFKVYRGQKYLIAANAPGYTPISLIFDLDVFGTSFNMVMEPQSESSDEEINTDTTNQEIQIPTNAGESIVFDKIYYDYNSAVIKAGAANELDALAAAMTSRPEMKIRLESHTDSRGAAAYNLQLSINRAESARNYLTNRGIDEDRIKIRGWGETKLRNACTDTVPCTDAKHAFNRRTEVIIEN